MTASLLKVRELSIAYRHRSVVHEVVSGVSFEAEPGRVLGIIGESGSGKSSLALALLGLHDLSQTTVTGEVLFRGEDLLRMDESSLCRVRGAGIGMIFQDPMGALDPTMKVEDQVAEAITIHRGLKLSQARKEARRHLHQVGVTDKILAVAPYAHQLSGGLRQRAMIAAALACEPALLVADEPTSSLDVRLQSQIIQLMKTRCTTAGLSIIFISHDLALVGSFADEVLVLHKGQVVEKGSCDDVLLNPSHSYTAALISAAHFKRVPRKALVANT